MLATYGKCWQFLSTFVNLWQMLATLVNFWLLMENFGNCWQHMANVSNFWQQCNLWQMLATYGNLWQMLTTFVNFWQLREDINWKNLLSSISQITSPPHALIIFHHIVSIPYETKIMWWQSNKYDEIFIPKSNSSFISLFEAFHWDFKELSFKSIWNRKRHFFTIYTLQTHTVKNNLITFLGSGPVQE